MGDGDLLLTSFSVLLPVLFVILLGYWAGRSHRFDTDQVKGINALVLDFAFPALMFVGISSTSRSEMFAELPFLFSLFIGFAGFYVAALFIGRRLLRPQPRRRCAARLLSQLSVGCLHGHTDLRGSVRPGQPSLGQRRQCIGHPHRCTGNGRTTGDRCASRQARQHPVAPASMTG